MKTGHFLLIISLLLTLHSHAITKTTQGNGDWNDPAIWDPTGVPSSSDDAVIRSGDSINISTDQTIKSLNVQSSSKLIWSPSKRLTITGTFAVDGLADMNGGLITISTAGQRFSIGSTGTFIWDPGMNTSNEATLFTRGAESFASTSTLVIKRWFNYANTLGQYVVGDFGNLTINTPGPNNTIVEWNQKNQFQLHKVLGQLTVDQGWVTLDKSGSITVTPIGSILLKGMNSTFYGHNGTHPSSFSIVTSSITNNGGTFFGLNDGNGNVTVHCIGDFINYGNVKIINNSGVLNVSNGNANFQVDGNFTQQTGDTRIIYNITTINSGTYTASFGSINLNGGIFMGQTACHTNAGTCSFSVTNDINVNFRNSTDKFRVTSLTSLGTAVNNIKVNFRVSGNITLNGVNSSEFTGSASAGEETVAIGGSLNQSGTTCNFNYGTNIASHQLNLSMRSLNVTSGVNYLSRNNANARISIADNVILSGGISIIKGGSGLVNIDCGRMTVQGGNLYLHSNTSTPTVLPIRLTVNGNFNHTAGYIYFDDNMVSGGSTNYIEFLGDSINLTGAGVITRAGAGAIPIFGEIRYSKNGTTYFNRNNNHLIEQAIQLVSPGTEVNVTGNSFQVSAHSLTGINELIVESGGALSLNNGQILSNTRAANCQLLIDSAATLRTGRSNGLFDGTINGAINPSGNLSYSLHKSSVVEYNGFTNQTVTGITNSTDIDKKYGVLRINLRGSSNTAILRSQVFVRTGLEMTRGELTLNLNTLFIENGSGSAITRQLGYIKSEDYSPNGQSFVRWQNIQSGLHIIPFGVSGSEYIPVHINPFSGFGNEIQASTWRTNSDNQPYPTSPSFPTSTYNGRNTIDRWWFIRGQSMKADLLLTYTSTENSSSLNGTLKAIPTYGINWGMPCFGTSTLLSNTGNVTATGTFLAGTYMINGRNVSSPSVLFTLDADILDGSVKLSWINSNDNISAVIEKSIDNISFQSIGRSETAYPEGNSYRYHFTDFSLTAGRSYYRVKLELPDGSILYSEVKVVQNTGTDIGETITAIQSVSPNPFSDHINIEYSGPTQTRFTIYDQSGQIVAEQMTMSGTGNKETISGLDHLSSGVYFLVMQTSTEKITKKIIKQ